ncbi:GntR family transcriptional regulator [Nocardiopsis changdeensis]|uniref:GntR family transcriptional regulator n=1 Tax=Nocardiopsis changdeensis TaxID=2831969 RepID=A0A975KT34_9ACTN|nr:MULTISPECIES: GntR family transcriptional regulator [Nocardiopsis]QUX26495.1 GntR family transcriptional regulator [Nocardiopsis changdeensis]QYX40767.1 GntR family transcriptional regulator [Nocardiopsis sp. MT53]
MPRWDDIAADLRQRITEGEFAPGTALPRESDLMAHYQASRTPVRQAVAALAEEGLVDKVRRRGTLVRPAPDHQVLTRARRVFRDEIGYYFDPVAQPWRALQTPTVATAPAPADIARLLDVAPATPVTTRTRLMGDPRTRTPVQLAVSYLHPDAVAELPVLAAPDTGPGGIYDRLEEAGHGPLEWAETITARAATAQERRALELRAGVPVLRIIRTTRSARARGPVVEVNDTRMSADRFAIGYPLERPPAPAPADR